MSASHNTKPPLTPTPGHGLRPCQRHITAHTADGKSVFLPSAPPLQYLDRGLGYAITRAYALSHFPAPLKNDAELTSYLSADGEENESSYTNATHVVIDGGAIVNILDMGPGAESAMHRTVSVDFAICTAGEIECALDSGELRIMYAGDLIIQRATMHKWRNPSKTKPARLVGITISSDRIEVDGKAIEQVYLPRKQ